MISIVIFKLVSLYLQGPLNLRSSFISLENDFLIVIFSWGGGGVEGERVQTVTNSLFGLI